MLCTSNCWLSLAPIAQARATAAHDVTCMQSKDLSPPAAMATDELEEDDAGTHAKLDDANLDRDWGGVVSLNGNRDPIHAERQST
jgi:hypothetical protein